MRVHFSTSGGPAYFPGLAKPVAIECDELPAEEAQELQRLVEAADFFALPQRVGSTRRGAADHQQHTIVVEAEGKSHTVSVVETAAEPALRSLVEKLRQVSTAVRKKSSG